MSLARFGGSERSALNASRSKSHFLLPIWDADHQKCKNVFPPFSRAQLCCQSSCRKTASSAAYAPRFNEKMLYGFVHLNFFCALLAIFPPSILVETQLCLGVERKSGRAKGKALSPDFPSVMSLLRHN
jgi:hypothetical protein